MNPVYDVDLQFLMDVEGFNTEGYVPTDKLGVALGTSGVTISAGVDLGNQDTSVFSCLSNELQSKLRPYYNLKGKEAIDFLRCNPLSVTYAEAKELFEISVTRHIEQVDSIFSMCTQFDSISNYKREFQTVVTSVAYQYGPNLQVRTPKLWKLIVNIDIPGMIKELNNFGDKYPTRRKKEANLLKRIV